jgi:competence protein ComEC
LSLTGYISLKGRKKFLWGGIVIVCALYSLRIYLPESSVTFPDVGFGDCAIIRTEKNECILIDGGGGFYGGNTAEEILIPYFRKEGIRKIDAVISTHSDADHSEGLLGIIGKIPVDMVYANDDGGELYYEIKSLCDMNDIPVKEIHAGDRLEFCGCEINILSPAGNRKYSSRNASSVVADVELDGVKFLFMADAGEDAERYILENAETFALKYDFLKAPHHGTHFATDEFLLRLFTDNVIISVGNNGYGLPDEEFIYSMKNVGCGIFRTDESGSIKIISADDGKYDIMNYIGKWRTIYESE